MNRWVALAVLIFFSCESDPPPIEAPVRVDAGAVRAQAATIEEKAEGELKRLEAASAEAAPPIADAGQKSGVNE